MQKPKGFLFLCDVTGGYISSSPKEHVNSRHFGHAQHRDHPLSVPLEVGSSVPSSQRKDWGFPLPPCENSAVQSLPSDNQLIAWGKNPTSPGIAGEFWPRCTWVVPIKSLGVLPRTNWSCLALLFSAGQLLEFLLRSHLSRAKEAWMVAEDMVVPMKKWKYGDVTSTCSILGLYMVVLLR